MANNAAGVFQSAEMCMLLPQYSKQINKINQKSVMCGRAGVPNSNLCASYASDFMNEFICKSVMG